MSGTRIAISIVAVLWFAQVLCAQFPPQFNVAVIPSTPSNTDPITLQASGIEYGTVAAGAWTLSVAQNGSSLTWEVGIGRDYTHIAIPEFEAPWSTTEMIGALPAGTYDLTVNFKLRSAVIFPPTYTFKGSEQMNFTVLPEPSILWLLLAGMPLLAGRSRLPRSNDQRAMP
jgi:hypothetical protein